MDSLTLTLSDKSSSLYATYHPAIELDTNYNYECALVDFNAYFSMPNVTDSNNCFTVICLDRPKFEVFIPTGSYELSDIIKHLHGEFRKREIRISIEKNEKTLKCEIRCTQYCVIDFEAENSIGSLLGFNRRKIIVNADTYRYNEPIISDNVVDIHKVNVLRIECSIATGSYLNDKSSHSIHEFYPEVAPGYKIVEVPRHLIYLPVVGRTISELNIKVLNQDDELIDFRGERVTIRIHIKKTYPRC